MGAALCVACPVCASVPCDGLLLGIASSFIECQFFVGLSSMRQQKHTGGERGDGGAGEGDGGGGSKWIGLFYFGSRPIFYFCF